MLSGDPAQISGGKIEVADKCPYGERVGRVVILYKPGNDPNEALCESIVSVSKDRAVFEQILISDFYVWDRD